MVQSSRKGCSLEIFFHARNLKKSSSKFPKIFQKKTLKWVNRVQICVIFRQLFLDYSSEVTVSIFLRRNEKIEFKVSKNFPDFLNGSNRTDIDVILSKFLRRLQIGNRYCVSFSIKQKIEFKISKNFPKKHFKMGSLSSN